MFYYPFVLHRQSGCFSTIWLAATKGIRVNRRELLSVNIKQTCGDILDYVTARVPAPQPNQPKPRFSLYLSSQLQYGVIVVYHRQCVILLEEVQQTIGRLVRFKSCIHIDMAESERMVLDVPDRLHTMEEAEGAQDPFFGLMGPDQLPSPYKVHMAEFVIEEHSLVPSSDNTPNEKGFRSTPAAITLTEKEQFVINTAEHFEGDDLLEATARDIDLLLDQPDLFRGGDEQQTEERTGEAEGAGSFIDQLKETMVRTELDGVWQLDEELGKPAEAPGGDAPREMTPVQVALPSPPSGPSRKDSRDRTSLSSFDELTVGPVRKSAAGRRRQLVFADPKIQLSDRAMKEQIENPLAETLDLSEVLLDFHSLTLLPTPAQLFSAPCGSLLHADLQALWKQQAFITALQDEDQGGQEEEEEAGVESEQDREILRAERKRKEISRESGLHPAELSSAMDVMLDVSKEDKSVSDVITPVSRWSIQEDVQPLMEPIAEEMIEMPEAQTDVECRETLSLITSLLQRLGKVSFHSLLPPGADRFTAAHTLIKLLELVSAGQVTVRQTKPYSNITVKLKAAESV